MELARGVQLKGVVLALGVRHDEIQRAQQVRLKGVQERRLGGGDCDCDGDGDGDNDGGYHCAPLGLRRSRLCSRPRPKHRRRAMRWLCGTEVGYQACGYAWYTC